MSRTQICIREACHLMVTGIRADATSRCIALSCVWTCPVCCSLCWDVLPPHAAGFGYQHLLMLL